MELFSSETDLVFLISFYNIRYSNKPKFLKAVWALGLYSVGPHQILRALVQRMHLSPTLHNKSIVSSFPNTLSVRSSVLCHQNLNKQITNSISQFSNFPLGLPRISPFVPFCGDYARLLN